MIVTGLTEHYTMRAMARDRGDVARVRVLRGPQSGSDQEETGCGLRTT